MHTMLIPILHYRPTAQLIRTEIDRSKLIDSHQSYDKAERLLPTFINILFFLIKKLVYKMFYVFFNVYYIYVRKDIWPLKDVLRTNTKQRQRQMHRSVKVECISYCVCK